MVDQAVGLLLVVRLDVDHHHPQAFRHLRRGKADAWRLVHRGKHARDQFADHVGVTRLNRTRLRPED